MVCDEWEIFPAVKIFLFLNGIIFWPSIFQIAVFLLLFVYRIPRYPPFRDLFQQLLFRLLPRPFAGRAYDFSLEYATCEYAARLCSVS